MDNNKYSVVGTDGNTKSLLASVFGDLGTPQLSSIRCCDSMHYEGTTTELLKTYPLSISGYGIPQYSTLNKCFKLTKEDYPRIENEMKKNNLNTEEIYDSIYKKKEFKPKKNLLGEDVISYRIVSDKEKKLSKKVDSKKVDSKKVDSKKVVVKKSTK
jgi:hypothetical protein